MYLNILFKNITLDSMVVLCVLNKWCFLSKPKKRKLSIYEIIYYTTVIKNNFNRDIKIDKIYLKTEANIKEILLYLHKFNLIEIDIKNKYNLSLNKISLTKNGKEKLKDLKSEYYEKVYEILNELDNVNITKKLVNQEIFNEN